MAAKKKTTFEQAMARLEEIVKCLEQGDVPLEASMALFEEGTKLSAELNQMLDRAEQKVSVINHDADGQPPQEGEEQP